MVPGHSEQKADRFEAYKTILSKEPCILSAIAAVEKERPLRYDTGLYLYALLPALTKFVGWVLDEAAASGKQRLYFLSRDGWQMYQIALRLAELRGLSLECRYLYVSRYAMRVPEYHLNPAKSMDKICVGGIDVTLEKILGRAALTVEEAVEIIFAIGWQDRYRDILNHRQIQELKKTLMQQKKLLQYMEAHSADEYQKAMGYLKQEGLLSETPYAIVDSGWTGTLQQSIQTLLRSHNPDISLEGYYFGLYELPKEADPDKYHAYYFSPEKGLARKVHFSNSLFETICSSKEGMTVGYVNRNGSYAPKTDLSDRPNREQLEENLRVLERFLHYYKEPEGGKRQTEAEKKTIEKLFLSFMSKPTELAVKAYGDNLFSDDVLENDLKKVAAELTGEEILDQRLVRKLFILSGIKKTSIHESAWIEGSIVRYGENIKSNLYHARLYKYFIYARKQIKAGKRQDV